MTTRVFAVQNARVSVDLPCIVCCTAATDDWSWLERLDGKPRHWYICAQQAPGLLEQLFPGCNLAAIRASWQATQIVKQRDASMLVTSNPALSFWCAVFVALQKLNVDHIATSFYLPRLPDGWRYILAQWAYSTISRLIVHSKAEKQLYGEYFGIPSKRFEMQYRGMILPELQPPTPLEPGDYICAICNDRAQDFPTLMAAIAQLPHIPLVLIVTRGQAIGTKIPPNVKLRSGLSPSHTLNLLHYSRFLVFPLRHSRLPFDHATLVAAMHLSKSFVAPDLPSISDYAFNNSNALLYEPANPAALATSIRKLWSNPVKCQTLGENGRGFADAFCSQRSTQKYMQQLLVRRGL